MNMSPDRLLWPAALAAAVLAAACATPPSAAPAAGARPRIERAADLPRSTYRFDQPLREVLRSDAAFAPFAQALQRDTERLLADYDIADRSTRTALLATLANLEFLAGRYERAIAHAEALRALQDKPADQLLAGLRLRAMASAAKTHTIGSPAYVRAVGDYLDRALADMPAALVANGVREAKMGAELLGEGRIVGSVNEQLQPIVDRSGALSSDFAPMLASSRLALRAVLPLKDTLVASYSRWLAQHTQAKPDIWAARDVSLPAGAGYTPVRVAVWDSGVDTALFPGQLLTDGQGRVAQIAFDKYSRPADGVLQPLPAEFKARLPQMVAQSKGFSDLQSDIDSAEAATVKQLFSGLTPEAYKATIEDLRLAGNYEHGTHVAGIALAGNPYARLAVARIEFGHTLRPEPCPSVELAERDARSVQQVVDFFQREQVRVVNMSWGGSVGDVAGDLEQCGIGADPAARKALARQIFDIGKQALTQAYASAPQILFIAAAGNNNDDPTFSESVPADIVLPNLLTVGAVDAAGDEAAFTSVGPTVRLHANGYQVESFLPGGTRVALSGTSMAAPQAANLAAKLLAVQPSLTPPQVIALMIDSADRSADGRRVLMNPKRALAAARQ